LQAARRQQAPADRRKTSQPWPPQKGSICGQDAAERGWARTGEAALQAGGPRFESATAHLPKAFGKAVSWPPRLLRAWGLATRFRELSGWWKLVVVVGTLMLTITIVQALFVSSCSWPGGLPESLATPILHRPRRRPTPANRMFCDVRRNLRTPHPGHASSRRRSLRRARASSPAETRPAGARPRPAATRAAERARRGS